MNTDFFDHDHFHPWGDSATHPIEPPWRALAALTLLAGRSQLRRHALPVRPMTAHSGASNCRI